LDLLTQHPWPGTVRELKNVMERMVIMVPGTTISPFDLLPSLRLKTTPTLSLPLQGGGSLESEGGTLREARERFEREYIVKRLEANGWNVSKTAMELGIERSHLHRKMKAYGLMKQ
ncbi:MAG: helix-turn-helix domain-containing protein, partial [Candidatus Methylomirabilales bacterium]